MCVLKIYCALQFGAYQQQQQYQQQQASSSTSKAGPQGAVDIMEKMLKVSTVRQLLHIMQGDGHLDRCRQVVNAALGCGSFTRLCDVHTRPEVIHHMLVIHYWLARLKDLASCLQQKKKKTNFYMLLQQ